MSGLSFTGKVVLVTGASSTVGSELAKYFSKLGASLVLIDYDKYRLNKVGEECSGNPVLKIAADLTKNEDVTGVIKQTIAEFKKLDVLINYVGPTDNFTADGETPIDAFKFIINAGVCSVYSLTQLAYPHLVKTRGNVVNVHGILSNSTSNILSCQVSRSALEELTRSLASEFSSEGVRVNAVSAGSVENRPENSGKPSLEKPGGFRTHLGPEDVAAAVVFLASDLAAFIVGANLPVDGGKRLTSEKDGPVENNKEKSGKGAARPNALKSEGLSDSQHRKEQCHVDGRVIVEQPKRDAQKEEHPKRDALKEEHAKGDAQKEGLAKQSSPKPDSRKTEADKSPSVKHQVSEKMSKPASKNTN